MLQTEIITRNRTNVVHAVHGLQLRSGAAMPGLTSLAVWSRFLFRHATMTREFLGDSDQATLPAQQLLIGLSANDNLTTGNGTKSS